MDLATWRSVVFVSAFSEVLKRNRTIGKRKCKITIVNSYKIFAVSIWK